MAPPSKRPVRRSPEPDDDDEEVTSTRNVEDDPRVKKARQRLREANEANGDDDDDEDEDEAPRRPTKSKAEPAASKLRGGWTDAQKQMDSTSDYAQALKLEEKSVFIKFLDDTSYVNYRRHWVERSTAAGKSLRAYTCLQSIDKPCPVCDVGERAQAVAAYNVALIGDDGQVLLKTWDVGPRLFNVLKGYANDPRIGPLSRGYFMVSKTGKKGTVQHNVSHVSKTALREDHDIEPPTQEELDTLVKYTPEVVQIPSVKTMRELAEELADEYE